LTEFPDSLVAVRYGLYLLEQLTTYLSKYAYFFYSQGSYFRGIEHTAIDTVAFCNKIKCCRIDNLERLQWSSSSPCKNGELWWEAKCV